MPPFYFLTFAKVSVSVSKKFGLKKVSVSVSKTFGLEKKSRYRSRKHLVSKKSLGIGLENIWSRKKVSVSVSKILVSKKSLGIGLDEIFWSRHSVIICQPFFLLETNHFRFINEMHFCSEKLEHLWLFGFQPITKTSWSFGNIQIRWVLGLYSIHHNIKIFCCNLKAQQ